MNAPSLESVRQVNLLGKIHLSEEEFVFRIMSRSLSNRRKNFRDRVRTRDRKCVLSGTEYAESDDWDMWQAAHIFPYANEQYWRDHNFRSWITDMDPSAGESKIHSVQNGLLMRPHCHNNFDLYRVAVNPDVGSTQ